VRQIAERTDSELDATTQKIGVKRERIRREDWVGRAKRVLESA
jgi:predicted flap endonuclease-1-like 5' DNA nuclease